MNQGSSTNLIVTSLGTTTSEHIHATVKGIDLLLSGGGNSSTAAGAAAPPAEAAGAAEGKAEGSARKALKGFALAKE